jgi:leucyl/phenylalanyl-tRNA--protein transferase
MPVYRLDDRLVFPPPELGPRRGPIAVGGDLRPDRLLLAYSMGIFPWEGHPLRWHSPDPRMVLLASELHVSRSLEKTLRRGIFRVTFDTAFTDVMVACASAARPGQQGTWITPEMVDSYSELHRRGVGHSAETWDGDALVGGLYGLSLGTAFFGESMFAHTSDASKVAFVRLVRQLERWGIPLIDCQVHTPHLAGLGAREWPRRVYLEALRSALEKPTRLGPWRSDAPSANAAGALSARPSGPAGAPGRNPVAGGSRRPAPRR